MTLGGYHDRVAGAVAGVLGVGVASVAAVGGGDVARSFAVGLDDGRRVFAKFHDDPPEGFFTTEATGLAWLADAGAVGVPEVLAVTDGAGLADAATGLPAMLVLSWVDTGGPSVADEHAFGAALARLHLAGAPCFGREDARPTGSLQLPNDPCGSWPEFYAQRRLLPLVAEARRRRAVDGATLDAVADIAGRLGDLAAADEPPARLHGDLWAGNRLVDRHGVSWLIDPAAHGGHREFDLAMMALFGGFAPAVWEAYHDVHPLADGWQQRVGLHQLGPLLVHAIKFGGGYRAAVQRAVASVP